MQVGTPFGEFPFEFRRLERRGRSLVIVGIVAGLESTVVIGSEDLVVVAKWTAVPVAAACIVIWARH